MQTENEIIYKDPEGTFYISYLEQTSEAAKLIDEFCYLFGGRPKPIDSPETALMVRGDTHGHRWMILYGDHRAAYRELGPRGIDACMEYFLAHIEQIAHEMPEIGVR